MSESQPFQKSDVVIDRDYDGEWTEEHLLWLLAWIDLKTKPPLPHNQDITPNSVSGEAESRII